MNGMNCNDDERGLLPYPVILAATESDPDAMKTSGNSLKKSQLVPTDKTPAGKRDDISWREKEKEIQKDLDDGIDPIGKQMTVCQLYAKQIRHRANVRHGTKQGRKQLMRILEEKHYRT